jgi:putative membrane protein
MKKRTLYLAAFALMSMLACNKDDDNNSVSDSDRDYMRRASYGNNAEVDAGQMAATKGTSPGISTFGQMMVSDHSTAQAELASMAQNMSVSVPQGLDSAHAALKAQLASVSGHTFDSMYIHSQVMDHQNTVALLQSMMTNGNDQRVKDYASKYLPKVQMHLHMADSIAANFQ